MNYKNLLTWTTVALVAAAASSAGLATASTTGKYIPNSTPAVVKGATLISHGNPSDTMEVTVWLNPHNRSDLDSFAASVYNPDSPTYRHWLTHSELVTKYLPTKADATAVSQYLAAQHLSVLSVGPDNICVRARGTLADIETAFHVIINNYKQNELSFRANAGDVYVDASVSPLVQTVGGLDNLQFEHHLASRTGRLNSHAANAEGGIRTAAASASTPDMPFFSTACFSKIATENIGTPGQYPWGRYKGNTLYSSQTDPGCGYTPAEIRTAYNLNPLYKAGFDGTGQTIVIIDWCGSPTIESDANVFSAKFGLPLLTPENFQIINYPGPSTCSAEDVEINLDVEWAHAIAPGAKLVLLVPPSASFQDTDMAQYYAETTGLGNIISGSYGAEESQMAVSEVQTENLISEIGAVQGVAVNFSTGDEGAYYQAFPRFHLPSVSLPAASPYVTAVGGVSLVLNANNTVHFQTGWGTNIATLADEGSLNLILSPINDTQQFVYGSGGGTSAILPALAYQSSLGATNRQLPDIAWLADPFTPAVIAITIPGVYPQVYETIGGTSLACPMFAALWAIADQEAGVNLGQAAPYLYSMPAGAITDVLPKESPTNVNGQVFRSSTDTTTYDAGAVAQPLDGITQFISAMYAPPTDPGTLVSVSFGTDDHLLVTPGWDFVTGLGTPNGTAFANYFNPAVSSSVKK